MYLKDIASPDTVDWDAETDVLVIEASVFG